MAEIMEILFRSAVVAFCLFMLCALLIEGIAHDSVRRALAVPAAVLFLFIVASILILIPYLVFFTL